MEESRGEGQVSREEARRRRDEEFKKYMEEGQRKDEERLGAIASEHNEKLGAAQAAREKETQEAEVELRKTRERLRELGEISKKLDQI